MTTRRRFVAAIGAIVVLGCGRRSIVEDPEPLEVELTEPWVGADLPIGDGHVLFSNARMLTVEYEAGTVEALAATWVSALGRDGWQPAIDTSGPDMVSRSFTREGSTLALGVLPGIDGVTVTLTLFVP